MPIELNHTIVKAKDHEATARFFAEILGLPEPERFGPFFVVQPANNVTLDVMAEEGEIDWQHYAFKVSDSEFDEIFERIRARGIAYRADPHGGGPNTINTRDDGRGFYFEDPNGHALEILTRDYGSGSDRRG